ncbi:hypothetical protein JZM24_05645 [Candidatus Sodalis endolongispinus]|uniref:Pilus assembly protein PilO n=1 Tax=Candidatus Sodalis endolongispinus TaxID=2812662 RepID=A0ABS5Y9S0_9GAMM|nr:hypothetical protein [Candidatus Sodalis endolongispinus]MBT9431750.1 hypothetical protein [Candidatus Sodalis endolongispinus]
MTLPAAGAWRDRPVIKWLLGYALLTVALMFAGGAWILLPEKRRLEQVQRVFNAQLPTHGGHSHIVLPLHAEKAGAGPRSSHGGAWPPPAAAKAGAAPATGDNAGVWRCQRFAQDPVSLFMPPALGPPAGLRWRVTPAGDETRQRGWMVALTTDYAGLERLLSAITALQGCLGLQALSLKATPEGLMLDFRLTPANEKEDDNEESPAGA